MSLSKNVYIYVGVFLVWGYYLEGIFQKYQVPGFVVPEV